MTAIFSVFQRRLQRLRFRKFEAERRRFLAAWQEDIPRMSRMEIDVEISATKSAMRQIAEIARRGEEALDV